MFLFCVCLTFPMLVFGHPLSSESESVFPILMPKVKPRLPEGESYLCTAVETDPERTLFVTSIEPSNLGMETAHHLMLVGCSSTDYGGQNEVDPEASKNLWNCGGTLGEKGLQFAPTCQGGEMQVIYMWSRNGSGIRFPEESGMPVGGPASRIRLLVLQVHYINNDRIPDDGDASGVVVRYVDDRPRFNVGIISLHVHGVLKPKSIAFWDSACKFQMPLGSDQTIHPFAFLTHTHSKGIHASGWVVRDNSTWTPIGMRNPQEAQSFYPTETENLIVTADDTLAARCILRSDENEIISQGLTSKMEMCDYFILYWTTGPILRDENSCTTKADFTWKNYGLRNDPFLNAN